MKKIFSLAFLILFSIPTYSSAHSGRTDSCGGHHDRKHGGYHIHNYSKYCTCYSGSPECGKEESKSESKKNGISMGVSPVNEWDCPETHPIKGNINLSKSTRIFHSPGGAYYSRTKPEKCYATEEDALSDGFRKSIR